MSWMDSWSRPSKQSAVPPPLYITGGDDVPYCHTCGRVMNSRKSAKSTPTQPVKYCSDRCRNRKVGPLDKKIERAIAALLDGEDEEALARTDALDRKVKGDQRLIVTMDEVEEIVFGSRFDPEKVYGRRKNRKSRAIGSKTDEWKSIDMESSNEPSSEDNDDEGGTRIQEKTGPKVRPPQTQSEVNFSVGGERGRAEKIEESAIDAERRLEGQKKAEEREMVRRAARRAVVFGVEARTPPNPSPLPKKGKGQALETNDGPTRRKCEALMQGNVVEPSFAKGNWQIRWRE